MDKRSAFLLSAGFIAAAAMFGRRYSPSPDHPVTMAWYGRMKKSALTPPGPVFGGAWAVLYPVLGWSGYRLLTKAPGSKRNQAVAAWVANVAAIALHPYLLFGRRKLGPSTALLTAETAAAVALVATSSRVDRSVAIAQTPLVFWAAFADLLNEEMWRRN